MSNKIKSRVSISTLGILFMLLMSNLTLVIGVSTAITIPAPKIISLTHNATAPLTINDILTVTLVGDPFSFATFDLGDAVISIEMYDDGTHNDGLQGDGVYVGNYVIQESDSIGIYTVTGHLKTIESLQLSKDAAQDVIINAEQPEIIDVWHNANTTTLTAKDVLSVTLVGDPNLTATFDLGTMVTNISMNETVTGVYQGNYTIKEGDDGTWTIIGYLDDGTTPRSSKNATPDVMIDTALPWIKTVWHNKNTTTMNTTDVLEVTLVGDPYFTATFDMGIIADNKPMYDDGNHNDGAADDGIYVGNYSINQGDDGNWTVTGYLKNGSSINKRNATPNVLIDTVSPDITSVTHDVNKTLTTNDTFNVTLVGTPNCTAWFQLGSFPIRNLVEISPGNYTGNYTITDETDGSYTVIGYLQKTGLTESKKDAIPDVWIDTTQPKIDRVYHDAPPPKVLTTDKVLKVSLWGDGGLTATFDVGNATKKIATNVPMNQVGPTKYQGTYTIQDGDDGTWIVTGYLDDGVTPRSCKDATYWDGSNWVTETVTIDTIRPQIDIVWHNANESSAENSLDVGDVLNVTLVGESNLTATFDLGTIATEQMNETAPGTGIYKGNYTVEGDDDGTWTVIGYLDDGVTPRASENATFQVIIGDIISPNPPTGLRIDQVPKGDALTLTWDPWDPEKDPDLDHYSVYRSTDGVNFSCIDNNVNPILAEGYTDFSLTDGTMYYYYVTAVDNKSNESPYLFIVGARPQDSKAPSVAYLELRTEEVPTGNALFLMWSWEKPPDPDVCGYNLYRSVSYYGIYEKINAVSITGMAYEDVNLTDGVEYFYKLTALDEVPNESGYVGPISGIPQDTTPPNAPTGLGAMVVLIGNAINISWDANQAEDLAGYNIYRSEYYSFGPYALIDNVGIQTWYQDTNLIDGKMYYYIVTAFDEVPNESLNIFDIENATKVSAFPKDTTPPSVITGLTVEPHLSGNTLIVSWNEGDKDIINYSIYRSTDGMDFNFILNVSGKNTTYVDTGLTDEVMYYYYVIGFDEVLHISPSSAVIGGYPQDATPPLTPIGLTVNSAGVDGELNLIWINNTEEDIAGYRIYRSTDNALYDLIAEVSTNNTYIDAGLTNEIMYYYKISAIDEVPNQSPESKAVSNIPHAIPVQPTGLIVVPIPIGNALNISWNLSVGNIFCYTLYRSIDDMTYELITKTSSNVHNYIDDDLTDGVTYYYRISASIRIDVNLNGMIYSIITESQRSIAVGAVPIDTIPPGAPIGLSAKVKDKCIYLDWHPPDDTDAISYNIYRSFDINTTGTLIAKGITETNWMDKDIVVEQRYYYTVTAVDEVLNESPMVAKTSMLLEVSNDEIIGHIALLMSGFLIILIVILGFIVWRSMKHKERIKEEDIISLEEEIERELEKEAAEDSFDEEIEKTIDEIEK